MAIYNIIYTAPEDETYLWNGNGFNLLKNKNNASLFFSGGGIDDKKLPSTLKKAHKVLTRQFPGNKSAKLDSVKIAINDKDTEGGHKGRMTS